MKIKKYILLISLILLSVTIFASCFVSCSKNNSSDSQEGTVTTPNYNEENASESDENTVQLIKGNYTIDFTSKDTTSDWGSDAQQITLGNKVITIDKAGTYVLSGTAEDGQIVVNATDTDDVQIVLNNVDLTCKNSAPIYVKSADKVIITLAENSVNNITDASSYIYDDAEKEEPNAAIFSKDTLTINGTGTLNVTGNFNNGIESKDDLKIIEGNINVTAVNNGIKGKDCVAIKGGSITVSAKGNGIKASNDTDSDKGFILIEGGSINVTSGQDGIEAVTGVAITAGTINVKSGGGSAANAKTSNQNDMFGRRNQITDTSASTEESTKGIKADIDITVAGGTVTVDSYEDAVHSNSSIVIGGGNFEISAGDDGIHSDSTLEINGGYINITKSYEGLESNKITINDGTNYITASDDGVNAAGGTSSSGGMGGGFGGDTSLYDFTVNGGYIVVDVSGDGLDSNGNLTINGGTIIVNGPTSGGNGALDSDGTIVMTGGFLIAAGSSQMAEYPSTSSTQYIVNLTQSISANTLVNIQDSAGNTIVTFKPSKSIQSLVFSSLSLKNNETYTIYTGGESTGNESNGLYTEGVYSNGSKLTEFKISSIITSVSSSGYSQGNDSQGFGQGGFGGGGFGGRPGRN